MNSRSYSHSAINPQILTEALKVYDSVWIQAPKTRKVVLALQKLLPSGYHTLVAVENEKEARQLSQYLGLPDTAPKLITKKRRDGTEETFQSYKGIVTDPGKRELTYMGYKKTWHWLLKNGFPKALDALVLSSVDENDLYIDLLYSFWKRAEPQKRPRLIMVGSSLRAPLFAKFHYQLLPQTRLVSVTYAESLPEGQGSQFRRMENRAAQLAVDFAKRTAVKDGIILIVTHTAKSAINVRDAASTLVEALRKEEMRKRKKAVWIPGTQVSAVPELILLSRDSAEAEIAALSSARFAIVVTTDQNLLVVPSSKITYLIDSGYERTKTTTETGKTRYTYSLATKERTEARMALLSVGIGYSMVPLSKRPVQSSVRELRSLSSLMEPALDLLAAGSSLYMLDPVVGVRINYLVSTLMELGYIEESPKAPTKKAPRGLLKNTEQSNGLYLRLVRNVKYSLPADLSRMLELLIFAEKMQELMSASIVFAVIANYIFGVLYYPESVRGEEERAEYYRTHYWWLAANDPLRTTINAILVVDPAKQLELMRKDKKAALARLEKVCQVNGLRFFEMRDIFEDIDRLASETFADLVNPSKAQVEHTLLRLGVVYEKYQSQRVLSRTADGIYSQDRSRFILSQQLSYHLPQQGPYQPPKKVIALVSEPARGRELRRRAEVVSKLWIPLETERKTLTIYDDLTRLVPITSRPYTHPPGAKTVSVELDDSRIPHPSMEFLPKVEFVAPGDMDADLLGSLNLDLRTENAKKPLPTEYPNPDTHTLPLSAELYRPEIEYSAYIDENSIFGDESPLMRGEVANVYRNMLSYSIVSFMTFLRTQKAINVDNLHLMEIYESLARYPDRSGTSGYEKWEDPERRELAIRLATNEYGGVVMRDLYTALGHDPEQMHYSTALGIFRLLGWKERDNKAVLDMYTGWGAVKKAAALFDYEYTGFYSLSADDEEMKQYLQTLPGQLVLPETADKVQLLEHYDMCVLDFGDLYGYATAPEDEDDDFAEYDRSDFDSEMEELAGRAMSVRELLYVGGWVVVRGLNALFMREAVRTIDGVPGLTYQGVVRADDTAESGGLLFFWQRTEY